jgi:hypothetical protein
MPLNFYLAYGEGDFASTAGGVFMGLVVLTLGCLAFIFYSYRTYPENRS